MKKTFLFAALILALSSLSAFAQGPYIAADLGLAIFHDSDINPKIDNSHTYTGSYDASFGLDLAVGYVFTQNFRAEGEFGYRSADIGSVSGPNHYKDNNPDSSLRIFSFMANGYYDITQLKLPVIPYAGLGFGLLSGKLKTPDESKSDTAVGYQLMFGASFPINKNISVNGGYKLQGALSDFSTDSGKTSYLSSNLLVGARFNF